MKKVILSGLAVLAFVISSSAVPSIDLTFASTFGVFKDNSSFASGNRVGVGELYLLVWSQDSSYTSPVEGSIPTTRGSAFGSDYVLYSGFGNVTYGVNGDLDGTTRYTSADVGSSSILSGNVYLMMFNTTGGSPLAGTQYIVSPMTSPLADASATTTPPLDIVDLAPSGPAYYGQPSLSGTVVAVPEPSTIGLLLVGAGLVAFRRMRRS
jgi:hypothetical protein